MQCAVSWFAYYAKWIVNFSSKARPLHLALKSNILPLSAEAVEAFDELHSSLGNVSLTCIRDDACFSIDRDASKHSLAATLNQADCPVVFFPELYGSPKFPILIVKKEALAISESVQYWSHFLYRSRFLLVTDQKALSFMFAKQVWAKLITPKFRCGMPNWAISSTISFIVLVKITLCPMHCLAPVRLHQLLLIWLKAHYPILLVCTNSLAIRALPSCSILCALEIFHFQLLMSAKFVAVAMSVRNSNLPLLHKVK